jgi:cation diffusion facilitator family transporter
MEQHDREEAVREKQSAAGKSVVAAVALTGLKLAVGLMTGSLGILAEALHSALDLVAAVVTFFAVRVSDRPADREHHYGHGKVENLAALFETLLLMGTCVWIVHEAVQRLFFKTVEIEASWWAFGVILFSIVVDVNRSRMLQRTARKHGSQALEADALHFATDVWSSSVVLVGLGLVWLGGRLGPAGGWLAQADAVAALGVAVIVVLVSVRLGRRAVAALLDAAPPGLTAAVAAAVAGVPGVQAVGPVRVRASGASTFVDLTVDVARSAALEEAHAVAVAVEARVRTVVPRGDVVVHIDPVKNPDESLPRTVLAVATRLGLRTHGVHSHEVRGRYFLDLHVEMPEHLTLTEAHAAVDRFESAVRAELPHVHAINSHLEPFASPLEEPAPMTADEEADLAARVGAAVAEVFGAGCTRVDRLHAAPGGIDAVLTCRADPQLTVGEAHRLAHAAETRLRSQVAGIGQVLIHVEPEG